MNTAYKSGSSVKNMNPVEKGNLSTKYKNVSGNNSYTKTSNKVADAIVETKPVHSTKRISDEKRAEIMKLLGKGVGVTKVSKITGVSVPTIYRIKNTSASTSSTTTTAVVKNTTVSKRLRKLDHPVVSNTVINVGLVGGRHNMPVDKFVIEHEMGYELMFDYKELENICTKFIKTNVKFGRDGLPMQRIELYATGIQCALASFIKVANVLKVNLAIRHYNTSSRAYDRQVIWDTFEMSSDVIPGEFCNVFEDDNITYYLNSEFDEMLESKLVIKITNQLGGYAVLCKSLDEMVSIIKDDITLYKVTSYTLKNKVFEVNEFSIN